MEISTRPAASCSTTLAAAAEVYRDRGMPVISPAADFDGEAAAHPWVFRTSFNQRYEIRFLAT